MPAFAPQPAALRSDVPVPPQPVLQPVLQPAPAPQALQIAPEPAPAPDKPAVGFPAPPQNGPSAADHIARAPVDSLSHVELIARLASAMQRRRDADQAPLAQGVSPLPASTQTPAQQAVAPDSTGDALRAALNALREVK
jgi:hypothetical protein